MGGLGGPLLSCPVLEVTWELTSDRAARPHLDFSVCFSLVVHVLKCTNVQDQKNQGKS